MAAARERSPHGVSSERTEGTSIVARLSPFAGRESEMAPTSFARRCRCNRMRRSAIHRKARAPSSDGARARWVTRGVRERASRGFRSETLDSAIPDRRAALAVARCLHLRLATDCEGCTSRAVKGLVRRKRSPAPSRFDCAQGFESGGSDLITCRVASPNEVAIEALRVHG
jgi:hypothetical protein